MSGCAHSMTLSTANHNHHLSFSSYHHHRLRADMPRPAVVVRYVAATIGVAAASYTFYRFVYSESPHIAQSSSANPFVGPNMDPNPNPSDDELFNALRMYLSTQDLMIVTKKSTREAIMAKFPEADLSSRKDFLNSSIDKILLES